MYEPNLMLYMKEIKKFKPLTRKKEYELFYRIKKNKDKKALEEMITSNLRFVVSVAIEYKNQGLSLSDLINEGNKGLIKAVKKYDYTTKIKFISYAVWWIRQAILQALADQSRTTKTPLDAINMLYRLGKKAREMEQRYKRSVTIEEAHNELYKDDDAKGIEELSYLVNRSISLNSPVESDDSKSEMINNFPDKNEDPANEIIDKISRSKTVNMLLSRVTEKEADILRKYFGINGNREYTLEEIGKGHKLTRERVRQIKEKSLKNLRKHGKRVNLLQHYPPRPLQ